MCLFKPKLDQPQQKITRKFQITPNKEPTLSFFIHSNQFLRTGPPKKRVAVGPFWWGFSGFSHQQGQLPLVLEYQGYGEVEGRLVKEGF